MKVVLLLCLYKLYCIDRLVFAKCESKIAQKAPKCHCPDYFRDWSVTTCHVLIILLLVFCQIKCLGFFNSNVIHWINRSVSGISERLTYKASDNTISCKMVFNLRFLFVLFVPSEMTAFRNGITHSPPPPIALLFVGWYVTMEASVGFYRRAGPTVQTQ